MHIGTRSHVHTRTPASQAGEKHRNAASPGMGRGTEAVPQPLGTGSVGRCVIMVFEGLQSSPQLSLHLLCSFTPAFLGVTHIIFKAEEPMGCG